MRGRWVYVLFIFRHFSPKMFHPHFSLQVMEEQAALEEIGPVIWRNGGVRVCARVRARS